jgi:hypothetical protein
MALVEKPEIETSVLTLKSHQYILGEVNAHKSDIMQAIPTHNVTQSLPFDFKQPRKHSRARKRRKSQMEHRRRVTRSMLNGTRLIKNNF